MLNYQNAALNAVRKYAKARIPQHQTYVKQICTSFDVDIHTLINSVLHNPITVNFHPDRLSNNGKTVMDNLLAQGQYLNQFHTGTTNGGTGINVGGNRFTWEQNMFFNTYPQNSPERPKYGAINLFRYIDGASARFGSCFFTLKHEIKNRCTFAYGDSSTDPTVLCTSDTFISILASILEDVKQNNRLLDQVVAHQRTALAIMLDPGTDMKHIGRNLDYCIETHIHGDISLADDVDSFYMDESFQGTNFSKLAEELCQKYEITLCWIPKRQIKVADIGELFRGPKIPMLARKIDSDFGHGKGIMNALLIGTASRDSLMRYEQWKDFGTESDIFMYFKQLWHTVAYLG